jgi:bacterioferritin-associated ferredoxin
MIVCHCNVFSDHEVRAACSKPGADCPRTVAQMYRCLGCGPKCGRCVKAVRDIMATSLQHAHHACDEACSAKCPVASGHERAVERAVAKP